MSYSSEARRGGKLEDMAVHGTSIPSDSDMPSQGDGGLTGEVITGTGDQLPADVEAKWVGQDSSGGKNLSGSKHTLKDKRARVIGMEQDHVGSGSA